MYCRVPHFVVEICLSLAPTSIIAEYPSGKLPTTRVRRRISFMMRSRPLFVRNRLQCSYGKSIYDNVSSTLVSIKLAIRFSFNDQPCAFESTFFQITQEVVPGFLIFTAAFGNTRDFTVFLIVHSDRNQNRNVLNLSAPTSLQIDSIDKNIRMFADNRLFTPLLNFPINLLI